MPRNYWLNVFSVETWTEFLDHGGDVTGFSEKRWSLVQKIQPGDYLICYLTRVSKFAGLLEATGMPFFDRHQIWKSSTFPSRIPVRVIIALNVEHAVPALELRDRLTVFQNLSDPKYWSGRFQTSPSRWTSEDGEAISAALRNAEYNFTD